MERIRKNASEDNGYRASLRRACGFTLRDADGVSLFNFYKASPPCKEFDEDKFYFASCLQCLWKSDELVKAKPLETFVATNPEVKDSFEKKIKVLLDMSFDNEGYFTGKFLRLIKFCKSKGFVVDCSSLLCDFLSWDSPSRFVQKKYARALCGVKESEEE